MVFYSHNFSDKEAICSYLKKFLSEDHQKHRTMREKLKHKDEDIAVETLLLSFKIQLSVYILIFILFYKYIKMKKMYLKLDILYKLAMKYCYVIMKYH